MNITNLNVQGNNQITEINYTSDITELRRSLAEQSEEHVALTEAVNKLIKAIESKNITTMRNTASGIIKNIGSGTIANVLGSGVLALIENLARG